MIIPRPCSILAVALAVMALGVSAATAGTHQASLDGSQEVPPVQTDATGVAKLDLNTQTGELHIVLTLNGVSGQTNAHIHGPAPPGQNAGVMLGLPLGDIDQVFIVDAATIDAIQNGLAYFNIHTQQNPGGEIRGQISNQPTPVEPESWSGIKDHYR